jgi:hypothetical protein
VTQSKRAKLAGVKPSKRPAKKADTTAEKIARVLARIASGELVTSACEAETLSQGTLTKWKALDPEHGKRYARAREEQAHHFADLVVTSARRPLAFLATDKDGVPVINSGIVAAFKLESEAARWYASKVAPTLYGDKLDVTTDGKEFPAFVVRIERDA